MKNCIRRSVLVAAAMLLLKLSSLAQGRIVVNEFMAWSGCSTTSEYIELMNFGPGPMDIGCYIVTNGTYSVTIPANTVLLPGEYYVLAGQNVLAIGCGNTDSAITVDLNWNTCNCTNQAVPTTGDGFMKNGGSANEKVVLLNPAHQVIDAVSRAVPVSSSVSITSSTNGGACSPYTFDLDNLAINYEVINISTGIDNSYSRRVDGDCGWVKTTEISAGAPNKTGSTSSATYSFSTLTASECNGSTGSISIGVSAANVPSLFPMTYTLAYDADSNGVFDNNDTYIMGTDSAASSIDINNLAYGRYKITVGSSSGCNLQTFDFFIFNCYGVLLPYTQRIRRPENREEIEPNVQLWPNPTTNNMFLQVNGTNSSYVCTIVNSMGAVQQKSRIIINSSSNTAKINTDHLPNGIYHLMLYNEKTHRCNTMRFIKK